MATRRTSPWEHESVVLDAPTERPFRVVVVADTHSNPHGQTARRVRELEADAILHGGDIGDLAVLEDLRTLAPLTAVRGNIDGQVSGVPDSVDVVVRRDGATVLSLLLMHIAVYGPKLRAEAFRLAQTHRARLVVCGHSHVPFLGRDRGLAIFNPGSIGPRRGQLPITLGLLEIGLRGISLAHYDCETGEPWRP